MSKGYTRFVSGVTPTLVQGGSGPYLFCDDGKTYLDFGMGLGAAILGYNHPSVNRAIRWQLERYGISFSLPSVLEGEVAETLLSYVPWAEQLRFGKNGTDVTTAAVRLARAYTDKDIILTIKGGYHGWADWFIGTQHPGLGIPESIKCLTKTIDTDFKALRWAFDTDGDRIAAMILEPIQASSEHYPDGFLELLRSLTNKHASLLIFDEVLCGFRYRMGSAYPDVEPDLACFGKGISNGMPLSAIVGKRDIMKMLEPGGVFFSGTAGGECLSLAACMETLRIQDQEKVHERLWREGKKLKDGLNSFGDRVPVRGRYTRRILCEGLAPRIIAGFSNKSYKDLFQQECAKRGLLFHGFHNMAQCHTGEIVDKALRIYAEVLEVLAKVESPEEAEKLLEGEPSVIAYR